MKNLRGYKGRETEPATDRIKAAANRYSGMSESELATELDRAVREAKANGTYDGAKMRAYASLIAPRLTREQSDRLFKLLDEFDGN